MSTQRVSENAFFICTLITYFIHIRPNGIQKTRLYGKLLKLQVEGNGIFISEKLLNQKTLKKYQSMELPFL